MLYQEVMENSLRSGRSQEIVRENESRKKWTPFLIHLNMDGKVSIEMQNILLPAYAHKNDVLPFYRNRFIRMQNVLLSNVSLIFRTLE